MKNIILAILAFLFVSCSLAQAQEVTHFYWDAVATSVDGLSTTEPISYRIYCDPSPMVEAGNGLTAPIIITGVDGRYNCTATAYTTEAGSESPHSNVVVVVKQAGKYYAGGTLNAPGNFRVE